MAGTVRDSLWRAGRGRESYTEKLQHQHVRSTTTNKDGSYQFTFVPIGTYELTVEQPGFEQVRSHGNHAGDQSECASLDVALQVGTASQRRVEVQGDVTQVDTVSATLGKVETTQRIQDLPLAARDTMQLGLLQAGTFAPDQDDGSGNPFSVSGQRSESMTFLLDGADNNDFLGKQHGRRSQSRCGRRVQNYHQQLRGGVWAHRPGGIVNQVIKSGTNAIHGDLFDYFRNTALDASDYFLQQAPIFKYNIFGGTVGFPISKRQDVSLRFLSGSASAGRAKSRNSDGVVDSESAPAISATSGSHSPIRSRRQHPGGYLPNQPGAC